MGQIRPRGNRRWEVVIDLDRDPGGRRRQKSRTVHGSRAEAEAVLAELTLDREAGRLGGGSSMTVPELVERVIAWKAERGRSESTLRDERSALKARIKPQWEGWAIHEVRAVHLDRWYDELGRGGPGVTPLAPASVVKLHAILRMAFKQAVRWDLLRANPCLNATPPSIPKRPVIAPSVEQVQKALRTADELDPVVGVWMRLAAATGARRGALAALQFCDLGEAFMGGQAVPVLQIRRKLVIGDDGVLVRDGTKNGERRQLPIDADTVAGLQAWRDQLNERHLAVVGRPLPDDAWVLSHDPLHRDHIHPDTLTEAWTTIRERTEIPDHIQAKHLRHYVGTQMAAAGVPWPTIAEWLGHRSITTTMTYYAGTVDDRAKSAGEIMGRLLGP